MTVIWTVDNYEKQFGLSCPVLSQEAKRGHLYIRKYLW